MRANQGASRKNLRSARNSSFPVQSVTGDQSGVERPRVPTDTVVDTQQWKRVPMVATKKIESALTTGEELYHPRVPTDVDPQYRQFDRNPLVADTCQHEECRAYQSSRTNERKPQIVKKVRSVQQQQQQQQQQKTQTSPQRPIATPQRPARSITSTEVVNARPGTRIITHAQQQAYAAKYML
jgi:hypothetical protein